jgi:death-on-curing protein
MTKEQIIQLNKDIEEGGIVINEGNLENSIEFANLASTPQGYASRLSYKLIEGHPFLDGNKRTGLTAALIILEDNQIKIDKSQENVLERLALEAARGKFKAWIQYDKKFEKIAKRKKYTLV